MFNNLNLRKALALLLVMLMSLSLFAACGESEDTGANAGESDPVETTPIIPVETADELVEQRSLLLSAGESVQLTVAGEGMTFTSSDSDVASVDENGNVTAGKKGTAMITITYGGYTDYCGVVVDMKGEVIDISGKTANAIFSDMMLNAQTEITGMAVNMETGSVYLSQIYGASAYGPQDSDIIVTRVKREGETWTRGSWMRFYESGIGYLGMESEGGKDYLWLESGGSVYGTGIAVSRVAWEDEACLRTAYGDTIVLNDITMTAPTLDAENDLLLVMDQTTGTYAIYDRSALLAGETPVALHYVDCAGKQTPAMGEDDSQGRYNASLRGFALYDGYIYQISGNNSIYVSVFDLNGVLQYVHRLEDYPELTLRTPAGIAVVDGVVYVTIQSGSDACYLANLWEYK